MAREEKFGRGPQEWRTSEWKEEEVWLQKGSWREQYEVEVARDPKVGKRLRCCFHVLAEEVSSCSGDSTNQRYLS